LHLSELINGIPSVLEDMLIARIEITGVRSLTKQDIQTEIWKLIRQRDDAVLKQIEANTAAVQQLVQTSAQKQNVNSNLLSTAVEVPTPNKLVPFCWPGSSYFHRVPHGFQFPSHTVATMWNLWILGDHKRNIGPYKNIQPFFDLPREIDKVNFSRTKRVLDGIVEVAIRDGVVANESSVNSKNYQDIFSTCFPRVVSLVYGVDIPGNDNGDGSAMGQHASKPRMSELNINTFANRMKTKLLFDRTTAQDNSTPARKKQRNK